MRRLLTFVLLVLFILPLHSQEHKTNTIKTKRLTMKGQLFLPGNRVVKDIVVILEPLDKQTLPKNKATLLNIVNKTFVPSLLVLSKNQQIFICNPSNVNHNIYSPGPLYPFDMGILKKNSPAGKALPFPGHAFKEGRVDVYCSMYENLQACLKVLPNGQVGTLVKPDGSFEIHDLAPGFYALSTWQKNPRYQDINSFSVELPGKNRLRLKLRQSSMYRVLKEVK